MHPILFTLFGLPIYTYGFMAMCGLLSAVATWGWLGRREPKFGGDLPTSLAFWLMLPGILGARLAYVLANRSFFAAHPGEILRIDHGGLIFYGGLVAACLALVGCAKARKLPVAELFDFAAVGLAIGHACGRVGCFMYGCCHGKPALAAHPACWQGVVFPAGTPTGDLFPDIPLIPVQLYEAAGLLALWMALLALRRRLAPHPGLATAIYMLAYAPLRFGLEFLRGDDRQPGAFGLDVAQVVSAGLFLGGLAVLAWVLARARSCAAAPKRQGGRA